MRSKTGQFGKPISFHQFRSNSYWHVLCFARARLYYSLLFLPLLVCFSEMFVLVAISCQLQKPIYRILMNMVHLSVQWLPEIWQLVGGGTLLWTSNCLFLNVKCSQKLVNLGNLCLSTILVQKLLTYVFFFCTCPFAFSSLPTFAFPFFLDVYLGCHQKAAAGTHT